MKINRFSISPPTSLALRERDASLEATLLAAAADVSAAEEKNNIFNIILTSSLRLQQQQHALLLSPTKMFSQTNMIQVLVLPFHVNVCMSVCVRVDVCLCGSSGVKTFCQFELFFCVSDAKFVVCFASSFIYKFIFSKLKKGRGNLLN